MHVLLQATQQIFQQAELQLSRLSDAEYALPLDVLSGSSVGMHVRHFLEFYQCLEEQYPTGRVCYDLRKRNPTLENNRLAALERFGHILATLPQVPFTKPLHLVLRSDQENQQAVVETNLMREIVYTLEHTIHHLALIKIGIRECFPHVSVIDELGVAPATLRFQARVKMRKIDT